VNQVCPENCVYLNADVSGNGDYLYEWSTGLSSTNGFFEDCSGIDQVTIYSVTVTDQSSGCTAMADFEVSPLPPLFVSAGPDQEIACGESTVVLTAFSNSPDVFYQWSFDGQFLSDQPTIAVSEPGTYFLIVSDFFSCFYADEVEVTLSQSLGGVNAGPDVYLPCGASNIGLDASDSPQGPAYIYEWSTPDGQILFDGNTLFPIVEAGTYFLTTTNIETGCSGVDEVVVFPSIAGIVTQGASLDCNTTSVILDGSASSSQPGIVYQWTTTDGNILNGANTTMVEVNAPGTYILMVTDTLQNCSATAQTTVQNNAVAPLAEAGGPQAITCLVSQPVLDASSSTSGPGIELEWMGPNGFTASEAVITVEALGNYVLVITDTHNGCTASDEVEVIEDLTPPFADAGASAYLNCFNGPNAQLDASNSASGAQITYQWEGPAGATILNANTATPLVDQIGWYTLVVTDTHNGCTASSQVRIEEGYSIDLSTTEVNCEEADGTASLMLVGINNPIYTWSNGASGAAVDGLEPGAYSVTVTSPNGLCSEVRDFTIDADLSCKVIIGGYAYADFIVNNCALDDLEEGLAGITVHLLPEGLSTQTDENGYYEFVVNTGDYLIQVEEQDPYILQCPVDGMIEVSLPDTSDVSLDNHFYFQVITDFDLIVSANSTAARAGELQTYTLNYCNFGIQTINGILRFTHDPQLVFDPVAAGASSYDPATYTASWNFTNLPFLGCNTVSFKMLVPENIAVGSSLVSSASVGPTIGDLNPTNNTKTWTRIVQAASTSLVIGNPHHQTKAIQAPQLTVYPNTPNPFKIQTTLAFALPTSDRVLITIFDLSGKMLWRQEREWDAGYHELTIAANELAGKGLLLYRIETAQVSKVGKMMKL
ncbi:MAG: hypothetical protein AAGD05_09545, partial [Bacteroidota bacterium]